MPEHLPIPTDLADRFGDAITVAPDGAWELVVSPEDLFAALEYLGRDREQPFELLIDLFAVDYTEAFEVVYQIARAESAELVRVRARLPRASGVSVHTVTGIWAGASWPEREMMEMYGIGVEGHPDPRNLLLPEGWKGYPLRKDYEYPEHPWLARDPLHEDPAEALSERAE